MTGKVSEYKDCFIQDIRPPKTYVTGANVKARVLSAERGSGQLGFLPIYPVFQSINSSWVQSLQGNGAAFYHSDPCSLPMSDYGYTQVCVWVLHCKVSSDGKRHDFSVHHISHPRCTHMYMWGVQDFFLMHDSVWVQGIGESLISHVLYTCR